MGHRTYTERNVHTKLHVKDVYAKNPACTCTSTQISMEKSVWWCSQFSKLLFKTLPHSTLNGCCEILLNIDILIVPVLGGLIITLKSGFSSRCCQFLQSPKCFYVWVCTGFQSFLREVEQFKANSYTWFLQKLYHYCSVVEHVWIQMNIMFVLNNNCIKNSSRM